MNDSDAVYHLQKALKVLRDSSDENKGVVAAGLVTPTEAVYETSVLEGSKWVHAERRAIETYIQSYGTIPDDATVVVSLSPCVGELEPRYGPSCTQLLCGESVLSTKIDSVYVGYVDPLQITVSQYQQFGLDVSLVQDDAVQAICEELYEYFKPENYGVVPVPTFVDDVFSSSAMNQ